MLRVQAQPSVGEAEAGAPPEVISAAHVAHQDERRFVLTMFGGFVVDFSARATMLYRSINATTP